MPIKRVIIKNGALEQLPELLKGLGITTKVLLVADENTYRAAGEVVARLLNGSGFTLRECILRRCNRVIADERALVETLINVESDTKLLIAVGSGTLNDITRYISYKTGKPYAVVATAPSMDGYASSVAALTINGCKRTYEATSPMAIIGDVDILASAPLEMIQAGLGDILGKYTSLADWQLGRFINGESYAVEVERKVRSAVDECVRLAGSNLDSQAIKSLMEALVTSGVAMLEWGSSRPASGSEHHISHFLEMHDTLTGNEGHLHGAKVGIAEIYTTSLYHRVFSLSLDEVKRMMDHRQPETVAAYEQRVRKAYGPLAEEVMQELKGFYLDEQRRAERQKNILKHWENLQAWVKAYVPSPEYIKELLLKTGAPTSFTALGIPETLVRQALHNAKEVRQRYTIFRLMEDIGMVVK